MSKRFFGFLFLLFSPWTLAEDYYWAVNIDSTPYPSGSAACAAFISENKPQSSHADFVLKNQGYVFYNGNPSHFCVGLYSYDQGYGTDYEFNMFFTRYGDGCPAGKVLNAAQSKCEIEGLRTPEQCAASAGDVAFTIDQASGYVNTCILGCQAQSAISICGDGACTTTPVSYTGAYCEGEDNDQPPSGGGSDDAPTDPTDPANNCPSGYVWTGQTCAKDPNGSGNGSGEGSGNGSGEGSGNGSGEGSGNGSGEGSGNGSGEGSGNGSGEGSGNGSASGTCSSSGMSLECNGDAVLCAIYKEQYKANCNAQQAFSEDAVNAGIDYVVTASEGDKPVAEEINVSGFFNEALNKSRWMPHQCLPDEPFTVLGITLALSWKPVCDMAGYLAPIIVFLASLFFAMTVVKALRS